MNRVLPVLLWTALSSCIFAQTHHAPPPHSVPNAHGAIIDPGFGSRMAATVAGRPVPVAGQRGHAGGISHNGNRGRWNNGRGYPGSRPGTGHHRGTNTVVVPYPVVVGGGYGYYDTGFYDPGPPPPEPGAYYQDPNAQQPPVVIINQNFRPEAVNPVVRDYSNTALPPASRQSGLKTYENPTHPYADVLEQQEQPQQTQSAVPADDEKPTIYLLAFKDRSIIPTLAYWVDGDTVNYITRNGIQNQASLSLIDKEFSKQLNDERHVEFKLPAQ
jgi:hypothetical protein